MSQSQPTISISNTANSTSSTSEITNKPQSFPKSHRLLTPSQFRGVFDNPKKKLHASHIMAFIQPNELQHPRLGLAITKKKVPTAVARNRLKRLVRENFRQQSINMTHIDIVFIVKRPITELTNDALVQQIQQILHKTLHQS